MADWRTTTRVAHFGSPLWRAVSLGKAASRLMPKVPKLMVLQVEDVLGATTFVPEIL